VNAVVREYLTGVRADMPPSLELRLRARQLADVHLETFDL
jgi:hypothetical protein